MSETAPNKAPRRWGDYLLNGFTFLVYVFMFAPIIVVILLSFNSSEFGSFRSKGCHCAGSRSC